MANNNEPLLHFGEENEAANSANSSNQSNQIVFNNLNEENKQEAKKEPSAQPVAQPTAQPTAPQPVKQPAAQPQPNPAATPQAPKPVTPSSFGKKNLQINLIVVNSAGVALNRFFVNKQEVESGRALTFQDEREQYDLVISADGYKDRRIIVTQQDLVKGEKRVSLSTQLQSLIVAFNTPDGIKRGSIDVDQTSAIYSFIKDASHTDTPLNEMVIGGVGGNNKGVGNKVSPWPYAIALAVGLVLGLIISSMFGCGGDSKETTDPSTTTEAVEKTESTENEAVEVENKEAEDVLAPVEETKPEEAKPAEEAKPEENNEEAKPAETTPAASTGSIAEADITYLKSKDVWNNSQISSAEAKKLIASFSAGDFDGIINSAYMNVPKEKRNGYFTRLVDDLKRIKGQTNYAEAKTALQTACQNGSINLVNVLDKMHRMLK